VRTKILTILKVKVKYHFKTETESIFGKLKLKLKLYLNCRNKSVTTARVIFETTISPNGNRCRAGCERYDLTELAECSSRRVLVLLMDVVQPLPPPNSNSRQSVADVRISVAREWPLVGQIRRENAR